MELTEIQITAIIFIIIFIIIIIIYSTCKQYFTEVYTYKLPILGKEYNLQIATIPVISKHHEPSSEEPSSEEPSSEEPSSEEPSSDEPSSEEPSSEEPYIENSNNTLVNLYKYKKYYLRQDREDSTKKFPELKLISDEKKYIPKNSEKTLRRLLKDISDPRMI